VSSNWSCHSNQKCKEAIGELTGGGERERERERDTWHYSRANIRMTIFVEFFASFLSQRFVKESM